MTVKVYYHNDPDGYCSAHLIKEYYKTEEAFVFQELKRNDKFNFEDVGKEDVVFMLDFCLQPFSDMVKLNNMCKELIWIDHHKSDIADFHSDNVDISYEIKGQRDVRFSGCELTWMWLQQQIKPKENEIEQGDSVGYELNDWSKKNPKLFTKGIKIEKEMPLYVQMIGRYDVWDKAYRIEVNGSIYKNLNFDACEAFVYCLQANNPADLNGEVWQLLPYQRDVEEMCEVGKGILGYIKYGLTSQIDAFEKELEGVRYIVMNNPIRGSQYFNQVYNPEKHDVMMRFYYNGKFWDYSLYSTKENIDVSAIAKKYGGGGHKGAAGFKTEKCLF